MSTEPSAAVRAADGPRALLTAPLRLHPSVSVRPEPFGALLYHFGTRRLTFVKDPRLLAVIEQLGEQPDVAAACEAVGLPEPEHARFAAALGRLVGIEMLVDAREEAL